MDLRRKENEQKGVKKESKEEEQKWIKTGRRIKEIIKTGREKK